MKNLDPLHATAYLHVADLSFVKRFHDKAKAKIDSIDLESLGVPGLKAGHEFRPYQFTMSAGGSVGCEERGVMEWLDAVAAPAPDDRENVRAAKLRDIDKLGRLLAVAAIRVVTEVPAAEPTLSDLVSGSTESFQEKVEEHIAGGDAGTGSADDKAPDKAPDEKTAGDATTSPAPVGATGEQPAADVKPPAPAPAPAAAPAAAAPAAGDATKPADPPATEPTFQ